MLAEVTDDFDFLPGTIPDHRSNAAMSPGWMEANFGSENDSQMAETAYVTGNPYSAQVDASMESFAILDEVWRYAWDDDLGTQPPRPITDRAIEIGRSSSPNRLLLHYMQPHFPSIPADFGGTISPDDIGNADENVFDRIERGDVSMETAWEAYRENCRFILNEVELLLNNLDADTVVITADHANAFGERGVYGHPAQCQTAAVRQVPYIETTAVDNETHKPQTYDRSATDTVTEDRLKQLGYL